MYVKYLAQCPAHDKLHAIFTINNSMSNKLVLIRLTYACTQSSNTHMARIWTKTVPSYWNGCLCREWWSKGINTLKHWSLSSIARDSDSVLVRNRALLACGLEISILPKAAQETVIHEWVWDTPSSKRSMFLVVPTHLGPHSSPDPHYSFLDKLFNPLILCFLW